MLSQCAMLYPRSLCLFASVMVAIGGSGSLAADDGSPFVAGFDRFHRETAEHAAIGGRLLISELSCTACHASEDQELQAKRGPNLDGAGRRYRTDWLKRYLNDPHAIKPGTTMPDVMGGLPDDQRRRAIDAIVAFLSNQEAEYPVLKSTASNPIATQFWMKGDNDRGAELYHQVGCVACHEPDEDYPAPPYQGSELEKMLSELDPEQIEELGLADAVRRVRSVPHGDIAGKYSHQSLAYFLYDPAHIRPSGRMPSLNLRPDEAADIATYLIGDAAAPNLDAGQGDTASLVEAGRRLFVELRCSQCHHAEDIKPSVVARPLAELDVDAPNSCIETQHVGLPGYGLDAVQIGSIKSALAAINSDSTAGSKAHATMLKMNCYACHTRDRRGGVGPNRQRYFETVSQVDIGDEGRLPSPLDGVGRKLRRVALDDALKANINVRPHMFVRMPKFAGPSLNGLAEDLANADAVAKSAANLFSDESEQMANAGRLLFDTGCVQCHWVRGEHLPGVVGIDLAGADKRLQPQWFHDFLLNPGAMKSRTRMPTFFPDGRSVNPNVLGGDTERQIESLWAYIKHIETQPLPEKIEEGKVHDFELVPGDRPLFLRTFMKDVGTHAIAVGFGERVHYAFDADVVRLAQAWRGRFIDAHGTWFDRFTPLAVPLGDDVINFPAGVEFATLRSEKSAWPKTSRQAATFKGFRIDRDGVPTFLYHIDGFDIQDRIAPNSNHGLTRSMQIHRVDDKLSKSATLWFRANAGGKLKREQTHQYSNESGLAVTLPQPLDRLGVVRTIDGIQDWIVPINTAGEMSFDVEYQW
ncbi:MAG: c-type cytochrome [Planctomycetales bacterium]|nr:c-type cytochrome [Planctomycetales bacterium]